MFFQDQPLSINPLKRSSVFCFLLRDTLLREQSHCCVGGPILLYLGANHEKLLPQIADLIAVV